MKIAEAGLRSYDRSMPEEINRVLNDVLAGTSLDSIVGCVEEMLSRERDWANPFGDGKVSERIVNIITGAGDG